MPYRKKRYRPHHRSMKRRMEWVGSHSNSAQMLPGSGGGNTAGLKFKIISDETLEKYPAPRTVVRILGSVYVYLEPEDDKSSLSDVAWGILRTTDLIESPGAEDDIKLEPAEGVGAYSWVHWQPVHLYSIANQFPTDGVSWQRFPVDIKQPRKFLEGDELWFAISSYRVPPSDPVFFAYAFRSLLLL